MGETEKRADLALHILVLQSVTVLPRCMQILSRRGFTLLRLDTEHAADGLAVLRCTVRGPERWHDQLTSLIERLTDVVSVQRPQELTDD